MRKLLIGLLLTTTVAVAQTTPKSASAKASPAKSTSALPQPSQKTKLQSNDDVNPNYHKEQAEGRGIRHGYKPRRTASGARLDTMDRRKKP